MDYSLNNTSQFSKRSKTFAVVLHIILLLLAWWFKLPNDPSKNIDTQFSVQVAFEEEIQELKPIMSSNSKKSESTAGKEAPKREKVEVVKTTPAKKTKPIEVKTEVPVIKPPTKKAEPIPAPTPTTPTEPILADIIEEEAPIVAADEEIVVDNPEPDPVPAKEPIDIPTTQPTSSSQGEPTLEDVLADLDFGGDDPGEDESIGDFEESTEEEGSIATNSGNGEDDGNGKTDSGSGNGDDVSGNDGSSGEGTGGPGKGKFDGSGNGVFGRKVVYHPYDELIKAQAVGKSGKIAIKVCINRDGNVTFVSIYEPRTTFTNKSIIVKFKNAAAQYKFEKDRTAPKEECGLILWTIDNHFGIAPK